MLAVKEKIRNRNRRKIYDAGDGDAGDGDTGDPQDPPVGEVPEYRAVSFGHLASPPGLNCQLSLVIWRYSDLTERDQLVDLVAMVFCIMTSSRVTTLERVWKEYQQSMTITSPSSLLRVKLIAQLRRVLNGMEGVTWEEMAKMHSRLIMKSTEVVGILTEEEVIKALSEYQKKREIRDTKVTKLSLLMKQMAKLIKRVSKGGEVSSVPDLEACLEDCTVSLEEEIVKGELDSVVRWAMDRVDQVVDMVGQVWEEVGRKEGLQCPVLDFGGKWVVYRHDATLQQTFLDTISDMGSVHFGLEDLLVGENYSSQEMLMLQGEEFEQLTGDLSRHHGGLWVRKNSQKVCKGSLVSAKHSDISVDIVDINADLNCSSAKQSPNSDSINVCSAKQSVSFYKPGEVDNNNVTHTIVKCDLTSNRPDISCLNIFQSHQNDHFGFLAASDDSDQPLATSSPKVGKVLLAGRILASTTLGTDQAPSTSLPDSSSAEPDKLARSVECEATLLKTVELLTMIEQFAGVVASPRLKQELAKLERDTGFVKWESFEARLEEDPLIVFGDLNN